MAGLGADHPGPTAVDPTAFTYNNGTALTWGAVYRDSDNMVFLLNVQGSTGTTAATTDPPVFVGAALPAPPPLRRVRDRQVGWLGPGHVTPPSRSLCTGRSEDDQPWLIRSENKHFRWKILSRSSLRIRARTSLPVAASNGTRHSWLGGGPW